MESIVVACGTCGQKNRLPRDEWSARCGHCSGSLAVPGRFVKMLRAQAAVITTGVVVLALLTLLASGAAQMWQGAAEEAGEGRIEVAPLD